MSADKTARSSAQPSAKKLSVDVAELKIEAIVLAAGQGTRMRSRLPKVLHPLGGRPLLGHVLDAVAAVSPRAAHLVVGHESEKVQSVFATTSHDNRALHKVLPQIIWAVQSEQKGTAHAVQQALPDCADESCVIVLYGDVPLITPETVAACVKAAGKGVAVVTAVFSDPGQLGRIKRNAQGDVVAIVEHADATDAEREITEINSGILAANAKLLKSLVKRVEPHNAQGEYYLTDIISMAVSDGLPVTGVFAQFPEEVFGVNDKIQLAHLERVYQLHLAEVLMRGGVTLADPSRIDIRGSLTAGEDTFIDANTVFNGTVVLGKDVFIGSGVVLTDVQIGDGTRIEPNTVIEGARIAAGCNVGPFARLRPGAQLERGAKVGNFVEMKKATLGAGSKASHLAYLGDATFGAGCNVGAGTITCNYDGIDKHQTTVGDRVFIGTNSTLVAPLNIGNDAFVAAGSTITTDVGDSDLGVGRARQRNIKNWVRPDRRRPSSDD